MSCRYARCPAISSPFNRVDWTKYTPSARVRNTQYPDERPDACKRCGSQTLTQRGTSEKSVTDFYEENVTVVRYRCSDCGSAFSIARREATAADSPRAALAWALGLSLRSASHLLAAFGVSVSRMSARRDVQDAGRNARRKQTGQARGRVRVPGADKTMVRVKGEKAIIGVATDAETGQVLGLEALVAIRIDSWSGSAISRAITRLTRWSRTTLAPISGGRASGNRPLDLHSPR